MSLLEAAQAGPIRNKCWAQLLTGEVAGEFAKVEAHVAEHGKESINLAALTRSLRQDWGVSIADGAVQRHFRGECTCRS